MRPPSTLTEPVTNSSGTTIRALWNEVSAIAAAKHEFFAPVEIATRLHLVEQHQPVDQQMRCRQLGKMRARLREHLGRLCHRQPVGDRHVKLELFENVRVAEL